MGTRKGVLAVCAIMVFALVATQAPAGKKHKHATIQKYASKAVLANAGEVGGEIVFCPPGSVATGGGSDYVDGIATVQMGFQGTDSYYVLLNNFDSSLPAQVNVQVACTAGTTKARGRAASRAHARGALDEKIEAMEAALQQETADSQR